MRELCFNEPYSCIIHESVGDVETFFYFVLIGVVDLAALAVAQALLFPDYLGGRRLRRLVVTVDRLFTFPEYESIFIKDYQVELASTQQTLKLKCLSKVT